VFAKPPPLLGVELRCCDPLEDGTDLAALDMEEAPLRAAEAAALTEEGLEAVLAAEGWVRTGAESDPPPGPVFRLLMLPLPNA
jgi:hypothetical protein